MANYNKVILMGNLTRDPQLSYLPSGTPVVEFGLAINRKSKDQNGAQREEVCFVDLQAYNKTAETINQYLTKGRPILVEGRLKYHAWEGKDGTKRSRLTVVVDNFQFIGAPPSGDRGGARQPAGAAQSGGGNRGGYDGGGYGGDPGGDTGGQDYDAPPPAAEPGGSAVPF